MKSKIKSTYGLVLGVLISLSISPVYSQERVADANATEMTASPSQSASQVAKVRPSADGYKPIKVSNKIRYNQEGFTFDQFSRTFLIQEPQSANALKVKNEILDDRYALNHEVKRKPGKFPAIILLHPGGQTARDVWEQTSLPEFTYANDFYLVAPNAYNGYWNDGKQVPLPNEKKGIPDDVGFLMALIERLVSQKNVDKDRIYLVGISNGGYLASHFACRTYDMIAGGASLLSNLTYNDMRNCSGQPIPWMNINGGNDKITPYLGVVRTNALATDVIQSTQETFMFFNNNNKCFKVSEYTQLPNFKSNNDTRVLMRLGDDCHLDTQNVLISVKKGGHQIPNIPDQYKNKPPYTGKVNYDIDTGTTLFNFFLDQNNKL